MGSKTKISWTDHTWNPWIGCSRVSSGCEHCYAEALARRWKWVEWGDRAPRKKTSPANWRRVHNWNHTAMLAGVRRRVFCASLADVFDPLVDPAWREQLWDLVRLTPALDWQILSKRPEQFNAFLPHDWPLPHVWLGVTCENQSTYDLRWPILRSFEATVRFVSYEPALGPIDIQGADLPPYGRDDLPHWVIAGGESGPGARRMTPAWARSVRDQCARFGVAFFLKQWGTYASNPAVLEAGMTPADAAGIDPADNGQGGALLDGRTWREFPETGLKPVTLPPPVLPPLLQLQMMDPQ